MQDFAFTYKKKFEGGIIAPPPLDQLALRARACVARHSRPSPLTPRHGSAPVLYVSAGRGGGVHLIRNYNVLSSPHVPQKYVDV